MPAEPSPRHPPVPNINADQQTLNKDSISAEATQKYWQELSQLIKQPPSSSFKEHAKTSFETYDSLDKLARDQVHDDVLKVSKDVARWFVQEGSVAVKLREMSEWARAVLKNQQLGAPGLEFLETDDTNHLLRLIANEDRFFDMFYFEPSQLMSRVYPPGLNPEDAKWYEEYLKSFAERERSGRPLLSTPPQYDPDFDVIKTIQQGEPLPGERSFLDIWQENRLRLAVLLYDHAHQKQHINELTRSTWEKLNIENEIPELPVIGEGLVNRKQPKEIEARGGWIR